MIVKSLSRHGGGTSQLLQYILRYVTEEKQQKEEHKKESKNRPFLIRHNLRARSVSGYIREFEKVESLRQHQRSNSVSIYHHILSFSSKDKAHITDELLKDVSEKFIALRGQDNVYVGTKHTDKEHVHLHLAMSAVDVAGRSVRISKSKFETLKKDLDRYQNERYPELSHSLPEHGRKSKATTREAIAQGAKLERASDKEALFCALQTSFTEARSLEHFLSQLEKQGYASYYRSGILTGVTVDGDRKFRFGRLGYPQEKLRSLDLAKEQEEKELAELKALRESRTQGRVAERLAVLNDLKAEMPAQADGREIVQPDDYKANPVKDDAAERDEGKDNSKDSGEKDMEEGLLESFDRDTRNDSDDDDGRSR